MALGAAQIGWDLWRGRRVETMQWLSLGLVLGWGGIALLTGDVRIVMRKPSLIYLIIGAVMLKRGWMTRYMPPIVQKLVPDVVEGFGFLWAGLMILSVGLNIVLAPRLDPVQWASVMAVSALVGKLALFGVQFTVMKVTARRRGAVV
jgi:intracellular septation protein A